MPEAKDTKPEENQKRVIGLNDELTQHDALGILIQGVKFAQSKGVFSLEDAALLGKAVAIFVKPAEPMEEKSATPDLPESQ
jgi:hypothetical protein